MILSPLKVGSRYTPIHPLLELAFKFLQRPDLAELPDGRHEISGDQVFALIARGIGRGQAESPLEYHQRYLDVQYLISGLDLIGWQPTEECRHPKSEYHSQTDLGFFNDRPATWCRLNPESFAIFFPEDAHAPLGGLGPFHKVVVKVAVENWRLMP